MEAARTPKRKKFGGQWYERVGTEPTKSKAVAERWAEFNRTVNRNLVRIIPAKGKGWEIYMRRR